MKNRTILLIIAFILSFFLIHDNTVWSLNVPLTVKERYGIDRISEPVTSGIPLSRESNITSISNLMITDSSGQSIPAQFRVLSRYDGILSDSSKPIRVILVDFQVDISSNQTGTYYLKDGGSGNATNQLVAEDMTHITISTGRLVAKINKETFNLFDSITVDGNQIITSNPENGIVIDYNGKMYSSYNKPTEIKIEENGPLRCVVKVKGYFQDSFGDKLIPPQGDNGLSYTVRIKAYKDKSYLKVDYTLENENQGWAYLAVDPVHNIHIDSNYIKTVLNGLDSNKTVEYQGYSDTFTDAAYSLIQEEISSGTSNNYSWNYSIKKNGSVVSSGEKYDAYADLRDESTGLTVASRWFWQNHPKGIEISGNAIKFNILPDTGSSHRILGGIWKTTELIYSFHSTDKDFSTPIASLKKRLIAKCPDSYYAETDFFTPMVPGNIITDYTFPGGEKLQTAINDLQGDYKGKFDKSVIDSGYYVDTIFDLRESRKIKMDSSSYSSWYGWLEFGDIPRGGGWGYSAQHYDWSYIALWGFLRFADYSMLDIGEELVSHKADIIVIHDPYAVNGLSYEYHGGQRYEADALMSYYEGYSGGGSAAPRKASHFWTKGMVLQYLLTGEERYKDSVSQCFEHIMRVKNLLPMKDTETRNASRGIDALVNGYKLTGDPNYLSGAYWMFSDVLFPREIRTSDESYIGADPKEPDAAWMNYDTIMIEPLLNLYYSLAEAGKLSEATVLKGFLERWSNWVKNTLYPSWDEECGSYRNNNTEYFPYMVKLSWHAGQAWTGNTKNDGQYSMQYADLFAFRYQQTGDESWLNLARNVFKDYRMYGMEGGYWMPIATSIKFGGFAASPPSSYLKIGKTLTKPIYYLRTEWNYKKSTGGGDDGTVNDPLPPTGLRIEHN